MSAPWTSPPPRAIVAAATSTATASSPRRRPRVSPIDRATPRRMTPTPRALPLPLPLPSRGASIASSSAPGARGGGGGGGYRVGYRAPRAPRRLERRAISEPSSSKSSSEVFVEEEMSRRAQNAADAATETPEEAVAALEEDVARLDARRLALTTDLDAAYDACFGGVTVEFEIVVDEIAAADADDAEAEKKPPKPSTSKTTTTRTFDVMDEETFRAIGADEPAVVTALIDVAKSDAERWLTFQRDAHRHKLQRDRVVAELAAARAELRVARRGGGAAAAAKAAMDAARLAAAEAKGASEGGILSDAAAARRTKRVVLISGFESFNVGLYKKAAKKVAKRCPGVELVVFSDRDIESKREDVAAALEGADVFFGSLLFDFDQVEWLRRAIEKIPTRFVFESALELMSETSVGSFEMKPAPDGQKAGPPPAVKAILSKFGSGKEEDKLVGYLSFLKIGPALLRFVPGRKAKDLRNWLTVYGYWNQGGVENVEEAFVYVAKQYLADVLSESGEDAGPEDDDRAAAAVGGVLEGLRGRGARAKPPKETPAARVLPPRPRARGRAVAGRRVTEYLAWYDKTRARIGSPFGVHAAPADAPSVAVLLYRKHVITQQPYLAGPRRARSQASGVQSDADVHQRRRGAHRSCATSSPREQRAGRARGRVLAIDSLRPDACVRRRGGQHRRASPSSAAPREAMEAGRQAEVAQSHPDARRTCPYVVAAPLLIQDIASWDRERRRRPAVLRSCTRFPSSTAPSTPCPSAGWCGDDIFLTRKSARTRSPTGSSAGSRCAGRNHRRGGKLAVMLYGFPPGRRRDGHRGAVERSQGAFYTLVPIRPRSRGERRSLRTLPGDSLRPLLAFNARHRRLSTPTDAFQLHPDIASYGTARRASRRRWRRCAIEGTTSGSGTATRSPSGEAIVDVLRLLEDGAVIAGGVPAAEAALEKLRASGKYADDPSALAGVSIEGASVFSRYTWPSYDRVRVANADP